MPQMISVLTLLFSVRSAAGFVVVPSSGSTPQVRRSSSFGNGHRYLRRQGVSQPIPSITTKSIAIPLATTTALSEEQQHEGDDVEPVSGDSDRTTNKKQTNKVKTITVREKNSISNGVKRPRRPARPPSSSLETRETPGLLVLEPPEPDMHVLVPVNDVVPVPLRDISRAGADSLGGSDTVQVSMERFSNTLESVFRTEYSVKVDRANAGSVLGWSEYGNGGVRPPTTGERQQQEEQQQATLEGDGGDGGQAKGLDGQGGQDEGDAVGGIKNKLNGLKKIFKLNRRGDKAGEADARDGHDMKRGEKGKLGNKNGDGDNEHAGSIDVHLTDEEMCVPLLQLVEELIRNAMFSPISDRDIKMSQALAAEFPSAARVRPVFENLADIYDLAHRRPRPKEAVGSSKRSKGKGKEKGKRKRRREKSPLPFEGKLLVFRRGNDVEETKGRLLLKKLDYLQSNAVGWLSQSVTDTIKDWQEQTVAVADNFVRGVSDRKDSVLGSCVQGAIAFGFERDTLARFLPVANETELALKEQEVLEEALKALRSNARRGPVNLRRYGTRDVNVKLEEFSEEGAWPPGDDSWFWDTRRAANTSNAVQGDDPSGTSQPDGERSVAIQAEVKIPSAVLPRVTLASVLSSRATSRDEYEDPEQTKKAGRSETDLQAVSKSVLSRLLSQCTVKEPTFDEVVVVYYKKTKRPPFRPPPALALVWKAGSKIVHRVRGSEQADEDGGSDDAKGTGLGLQLRVYRGVPLVNLNAITPDKKVEVRPQTALRLDLNSVVGVGLVLANLRFDSPVLVIAATASVVLLIVRTVVGYLNARVRVESYVSRDILDKTMGSNMPVLRHLAEEAAQQRSRHVVLVYAALLQCALDDESGASGASGRRGKEWGALTAVSMAAVSRYCAVMMEACVGLRWEAKIDVRRWLQELEDLQILIRVEDAEQHKMRHNPEDQNSAPRSLPLALEGLQDSPTLKAESKEKESNEGTTTEETRPVSTTAVQHRSGSTVEFFRLLNPDAAAEQLKLRWSDLVEPPRGSSQIDDTAGVGDHAPWVNRGGQS